MENILLLSFVDVVSPDLSDRILQIIEYFLSDYRKQILTPILKEAEQNAWNSFPFTCISLPQTTFICCSQSFSKCTRKSNGKTPVCSVNIRVSMQFD